MDNQTPPSDPNSTPTVQPQTTDQMEPAQQPYTGLPSPLPNTQFQPVVPTKSKGRRKWLLVAVLPILLLGGGSAMAYYSYYVPRQTNKKVLNAMYDLVNEGSYSSVKVDAELTPADTTSPAFALEMTTGTDDGGNVRADMDITYSALRLSGSAVVRNQEQTAYLKINELPTLLGLAESYLGPAVSAMGDKIGDKWLKFDMGTLDDSGLVSESQTDEATACFTAVQDVFGKDRQAFLDQLAKIYEQHSFMTAKAAGSETIDGQSTSKYRLTIDKTALADFVLSDQLKLNSLGEACGLAQTETSSEDRQKLVDDLNKVNLSTMDLWLSQAGKVVKIATTLEAEGMSAALSMTFGNSVLDASVPADTITTDELLQDYQAQMLNSLLESSNATIPDSAFDGLESL